MNWEISEGLSLRDYFAAKAMQGMLNQLSLPTGKTQTDLLLEKIARLSFQMADLMIEEGAPEEKEGEGGEQ